MSTLLSVDALVGLATLTLMEIVLGIDNVVFIAILVAKLPAAQQGLARRLGLSLALGIRILLLLTISWIMGLTRPIWTLGETELSGRSLILLGGGLFLMFKATVEIYEKVEGEPHDVEGGKGRAVFGWVLLQILLLDIVFSLDSVITAVGMANQVSVMIIAMVLAMLVMLVSAGTVSGFVERHPSIKILALAFLLLIGVMLVAEGAGTHMPKGYVYFAMAFSLFVEMLNMRYQQRRRRRARA
jgi:predicted tellurium resistance membrane protein TerC